VKLHNIIKRENILGFIDLNVPKNKLFSDFVDSLVNSSNVELVIYSAIGKYLNFVPNDTYSNNQWYLQKINAFNAWDITTGSPRVIVGIIDSGTDWTHSDLGLGNDSYQNIYLNSGEDAWSNPNNPTTGNHIDDDHNGHIDDWKGWNFEYNSNDVRTTRAHGTFVAGIISAKTNNNYGIAGIAGGKSGEGVKLLSYCVGVNAPISSLIDDAIIAAVDNGVKVVQLSFEIAHSDDIDAAIQYAISKNVLVVCAAGNNSLSNISYPASNDNVIAVGATDQNNQKADFSNYGNKLSVVAPGVDIYSTSLNNSYVTSSGTSFSAPQVSAIAALMWSANSNLTVQQVRNIIESTAQKVGDYSYQAMAEHPNGTWNEQMGYGLVDAYAAVKAAILKSDLMIRDNDQDSGVEPNPDNLAVQWNSPDIWLADYQFNPINDGDDFSTLTSCYIAVTIKNIGNKASTGLEKLHLYWSMLSVNSKWNVSWTGGNSQTGGEEITNPAGVNIPSLKPAGQAGNAVTLYVLFNIPNSIQQANTSIANLMYAPSRPPVGGDTAVLITAKANWGFAVLARVDDGNETAGLNETALPTETFAQNNNNVAIDNGNLAMVGTLYSQVLMIEPTNGFTNSSVVNFDQISAGDYHLSDFAELYALLSNDLMAKLNVQESKDIQVIDGNKVLLTSASSELHFDALDASGKYFIGAEVHFISDKMPEINTFNFDLVYQPQGEAATTTRFTAVRDESVYFQAIADANVRKVVRGKEEVTLSSNTIADDATYTWRDEAGNVIGKNEQIKIQPEISQSYAVEIMKTDDGYKSYDAVNVIVVDGVIKSLAPNPASNVVNINYLLADDVANASIKISNMYGAVSSVSYPLSITQQTQSISLSGLAPGAYLVQLIINGALTDSKPLIVN